MTITSFGEYPEPVNEEAIQAATSRWEELSPDYTSGQRICTISKIAIGILLSWGVLAGTVLLAVEGSQDLSTLGIVLSSVFGITVPLVTCVFVNLGWSLRTHKPYKYNLDNPNTALKARKLLTEGSINEVSRSLKGYCTHLKGAGILTEEKYRDIKEYMEKHATLSNDIGWFKLQYSDEKILKEDSLMQKNQEFEKRKADLNTTWEAYQKNHLPNSLPKPVASPQESTPLKHAAIQHV